VNQFSTQGVNEQVARGGTSDDDANIVKDQPFDGGDEFANPLFPAANSFTPFQSFNRRRSVLVCITESCVPRKKTIAEEPQGSSVFAAGSIELDEFTAKLNAELSELEFESGFQRGPVHRKLGSEDDVVTVSDWPVSIVGSLVPAGRRHELRCESGDVTQWKRRGSGGGWPDFLNMESETKSESRWMSAALKMVSRGRATAEKEKKKIMIDETRKSEDAIVGAWNFAGNERFKRGVLLSELIMKFMMEVCGGGRWSLMVVQGC
jgi:hypothetical protein